MGMVTSSGDAGSATGGGRSPGWSSLLVFAVVVLALLAARGEVERFRVGRAIDSHVAAGDAALGAGDYERALVAALHARMLRNSDPELSLRVARARAYLIAEDSQRLQPTDVADVRYESELGATRDSEHASAYLTARAPNPFASV